MTQKKYICPQCQNPLQYICITCQKGQMIKPEQPRSSDYNKEGYLESFCINCGSGFIYSTTSIDINKFFISKRNIKKLIDIIFTRQGLPYIEKTDVENKIFTSCKTREEIINFLKHEYKEDTVFIDAQLQGKYVNF